MLLSDEEVGLIMAAAKLIRVLQENNVIPSESTQISPARLGYMTYQEISGISIFTHPLSSLTFVPDDPPAATVMTLPGTRRRPVKPWHMCSITEKVQWICGFPFIIINLDSGLKSVSHACLITSLN